MNCVGLHLKWRHRHPIWDDFSSKSAMAGTSHVYMSDGCALVVMPVCEVCMSWVGGGEVMKVHKPILNEIYTLQCTCSICHNTLFRTEMCTFLSVLNSVLWDLRIWSITLISPCVNFCNHTIPTPAPTPPTPQNTNMCMICGTWNA